MNHQLDELLRQILKDSEVKIDKSFKEIEDSILKKAEKNQEIKKADQHKTKDEEKA